MNDAEGALPTDGRAWAEVDLGAVRDNAATLARHAGPGGGLLAVVKADAYGHGLVSVARAARAGGAAWLGVAAVGEGAALRTAGVDAPILLLCPFAPAQAGAALALGLTPTIGDEAAVDALAGAARSQGAALPEVHLEIDTGMGRSGVLPDGAVALWRRAVAAGLRVTGLWSHFSSAEEADSAQTVLQDRAFDRALAALTEAGARFAWVHLCSSAAVLRFRSGGGNLIRPGLLLYGIPPVMRGGGKPDRSVAPLRPALSLHARVGSVRELPTGHPVSYGATRRVDRPSRVATLLIGYGDGYPRRLSDRGHALLHGRHAPILGRVCMDQTVVDVTDIPETRPGDAAVCLGAQGGERITVAEIAALIETTEHEITTCLTARLPRVYRDS